jgi:transposase-like protein
MNINLDELARDVKTMLLLKADPDEVEEYIKNWKPATEDSTDEIKTNFEPVTTKCPKCNSTNVSVRVAESSDGAHEDYNYRCHKCNHNWWVDGSDY